jgi:hypothetical protein
MSKFQKLVEENPGKYPQRLGAPWDDAECKQLLNSIKNNKTINEIATEHGRTVGGIQARLRHLAVEYYNKDYDIDDIEELTGLSKEDIADTIARHTAAKERSKAKKEQKKEKPITDFINISPTATDSNAAIVNALKEIKNSIDKLINVLEKK